MTVALRFLLLIPLLVSSNKAKYHDIACCPIQAYRRKGQSQNIIPHLGPVSREQSRFGQNTAPETQPLAAHASGDPYRASTKWPSISPHI